MLLRTNTSSSRPVDGHLAALAGERVLCSEFRYRRGTEVFGEGEETEYVYQIISGAVRTYKLLSDGRRQINSFHLPGDMFGLENGATHRFTAEAVVETRVRITKRRSLLEVMRSRESGASRYLGLVTRNLQHAENHMLLLGRKTALERQEVLGAFRHVRNHLEQHHGFIEMVEIVGGKPRPRIDIGHAQTLSPGLSLGARLYVRPRGLGGR